MNLKVDDVIKKMQEVKEKYGNIECEIILDGGIRKNIKNVQIRKEKSNNFCAFRDGFYLFSKDV